MQEERNGLFDRSLSQDADHIDMLATVLCTKYRIQDDRTVRALFGYVLWLIGRGGVEQIYNKLKRSLSRLVEVNAFKAQMQERAETSYEVGKKEHESDLKTVSYRCTLLFHELKVLRLFTALAKYET